MKIVGTTLMLLPIQFSASHIALHNGYEFGSFAWWAYVLIAGLLFAVGNRISNT